MGEDDDGAPRVIAAGHVNWDVTMRVDRLPAADDEARIRSRRSSGGGSAANVAAACARLSIPSGLIGSVGDDEHGLLARRELEDAGVDTDGIRTVGDAPTTVKYLLVDDGGEVSVLGNEGANEAVAPEDVDPDYVRGAEHVHLTSQRPATAARIAEIADEAGVTVSFDPGRRLADRDFSRTLALADVLFLNDREAEAALEAEYPASAFADRVVVIKHGAEGAEVNAPGGTYDHPGFSVDPVDTTGAGDAFAAGFVAVLLGEGDPDYERALEFANACGALAAREEGARTAPTRENVESFLADRYGGERPAADGAGGTERSRGSDASAGPGPGDGADR